MRIAIDARELAGQPTGVGRFLSEIVREWAGLPAASQHEIIFCAPGDVTLPAAGRLNVHMEIAPGTGTRWEQLVLPRLVRRTSPSVLFSPGYSGPIFCPAPLVLAVHDVSFAAHPEWFGWREGLRRRLLTRAAARRAARVITISEFSRREIAEHLGVPMSRIDVIYPGLGARPAGTRAAGSDAREAVVLYVGSLFNRRHIVELIDGFARLAPVHADARLDIVGDNRTYPRIDVDALVRQTAFADRVRLLSYVPDEALALLYGRARAFAFLSEYEGFGLTPLEALAAGIPTVVLDTALAREVYRDAAIYVERPDPPLIANALERALYDEATRARVLEAAPDVLARYSWRDCATRVLDVLVSVGRT